MSLYSKSRGVGLALLTLCVFSCKSTSEVDQDSQISAAQKKVQSLYDIEKVVKIEITMSDWSKLASQQPKGGHCNFAHIGATYDWFHAESIKINGVTFKDVGAKKRSFCNSQSQTKPSLGISIDKYHDELKDAAIDSIGAADFTLNNSLQDGSYVRQCLAYRMFQKAGIASPLCNFANLKVNGKDLGIYVNIQPLKKPFFKDHYGKPLGNLYEIAGEQFEPWALPRLKGHLDAFEDDESLKDVKRVIDAIKTDKTADLSSLAKIVNIDQVIRYWAMEIILIHWDGFGRGINNANVYFAKDKKMRMVPWGTDQVFTVWHNKGANEDRELFNNSNLIRKLSRNKKYLAQLKSQVKTYMKTIYNEGTMLAQVRSMGKTVGPFIPNWQGNNETKWSTDTLVKLIKSRPDSINKALATNSKSLSLTGDEADNEGDEIDPIEKAAQPCSSNSSLDENVDWGWENGQTCKGPDGAIPRCSSKEFDTDGDGWGWENDRSCEVR